MRGGMSERRANRGPAPRTDSQVLANAEDVYLLGEIAQGRVRMDAANRMSLRGLGREDLCLVGFERIPGLLLAASTHLVHVFDSLAVVCVRLSGTVRVSDRAAE